MKAWTCNDDIYFYREQYLLGVVDKYELKKYLSDITFKNPIS